MKDAIRVVLIDPGDDSRQVLQRQLSGLGPVWLIETCPSYQNGTKAVSEHRPDLVVLGLDAGPETALALIGEMARTYPSMSILPASGSRDGELILRVIRAGAREFLPMPPEPQDLLSAIERLVRPSSDGPSTRLGGRIITFVGAAGGVGCTSLAVNLATTMAKAPDSAVALADFDLVLGSVDALLDIVPDYTLLEVAQSAERLDLMLLKRSMTRHESGLYVLPRPIALEDAAKIDPEALQRVLALLKAAFSTVVIDASKSLQASDFVAYEMSDTILMVVQLELTCLRNTARLLQLFRQDEKLIERVRVIVNRTGFRHCEISAKKAEETLNLPIQWEVPNLTREFSTARARGVPLEVAAPKCKPLKVLDEIAQELTAMGNRPPEKGSRFGRLAASFF